MNAHKNNDFIPISDIYGDHFTIPTYQRGYRWTRPQIEDLLNDFKDFAKTKGTDDYYCLQPLVVARDGRVYRVIDGQQRLTTIWMLLLCMGIVIPSESKMEDDGEDVKGLFHLKYERTSVLEEISHLDFHAFAPFTGKQLIKCNISNSSYKEWDDYVSAQWKVFCSKAKNINVESFHLFSGWLFIHNWLKSNEQSINLELFESIRLIWHEVGLGKEEEEAFLNLNGGKIPLTNAELIKALFLNKYKVAGGFNQLQQDIIAEEYDAIEQELRRDDFWYFLNGRGAKPTSCISFIFNLLQKLDGDQSYEGQEFRNYFYFRDKIDSFHSATQVWEKVRNCFHTLQGWYNTPEIYNLVGFLRSKDRSIEVIYRTYKKCKTVDQFKRYLKYRCLDTIGWYDKNLAKERNENFQLFLRNNFRFDKYKDRVWNLLLLINIITLNMQKAEGKDHKRDITRFSFSDFHHCEWNIEHISPQNAKVVEGLEIPGVDDLPALGEKLNTIQDEKLKRKIDPFIAVLDDSIMEISNLTFLSDHINKSIGNKPYYEKRECVIRKQSQGFYLPPSSLMIFTKGYNPMSAQTQTIAEGKTNFWSDIDRIAYLVKIEEILNDSYLADAENPNNEEKYKREENISPIFNYLSANSQIKEDSLEAVSLQKLTYSQLIERDNYIIIPKIQRDYAQGRSKEVDVRAALIRKKLLKDIFEMGDDGLDFQIVFGSEEIRQEVSPNDLEPKQVFIPIDGQQRLTTLFLLTLYRKKLNQERNIPVGFFYETRKAATDFCVDLVNNEWFGFPTHAPKKAIIDSTWFKYYWLQDPTVDAMLRMLDDIHSIYEKEGHYPDLEKIHFSYFNIGLAGRSDEIYLKMNTRGKELTHFENLKATLEKEFGESMSIRWHDWKAWKNKIDSTWLDAFWNVKNPTNVPDSRLLRFIANALFIKLCREEVFDGLTSLEGKIVSQDDNQKEETVRSNNIITCAAYLYKVPNLIDKDEYVSIEPFLTAFRLLGVENTFKYLTTMLDAFAKGSKMLPYWQNNDSVILDQNLQQRAAFYGASLFFVSKTSDEMQFSEWMRVIWNISEHDAAEFKDFIRSCRLFDHLEEIGALNSVTKTLCEKGVEKFSSTLQFKEEIIKASIVKNEDLYTLVKKAESHAFFHGTIRFLFDISSEHGIWKDFEAKVNNLAELVPDKECERVTIERLIPYLEDSDIKDVFHRWHINNKNGNLLSIFLYDKIRGNLQNFFIKKAIDSSLTLLQEQIIAIAPHHRDFYILNDWRGANGCYPCVLTNYTRQSGAYAIQSFPLDDPMFVVVQDILRNKPFKPEIGNSFINDKYLFGLEINFRYRNYKFKYYNENHTIRLVGSDGQHIGTDIEGITYILIDSKETSESLQNKLDQMVNYSKNMRLNNMHKIFEKLSSLCEESETKPVFTGFHEDNKADEIITEHEILSFRWSSVEILHKDFAIACTIDRDHNVEIGLRVLPGESAKNKKIPQKIDSSLSYNTKNHFWYYVYSQFQMNLEIINREIELLCGQFC